MYDAVWGTDELAIVDHATGRLKEHLPTIEDAARFYNRHAGVPVEKFLRHREIVRGRCQGTKR